MANSIEHEDGTSAPIIEIKPEPVSHVSYSQVNTWLHCGEQYRLTKIVGLPEQPTWWLPGGSAVHHATEVYDLRPEKFDGAEAEFVKAFRKETPTMSGRWAGEQPRASGRGKETDEWWLEHGPKMVQAWIDWRKDEGWQLAHIGSKPAVEMNVSGVIGGVTVKAYLDRVLVNPKGEWLICDIKTGSRTPDSVLQLGFYRTLLRQTAKVDVTSGGYWMARKATIPAVHDLTMIDEQVVERFVSGLAKARTMGVYVPNVTAMCKSCGVRYACAAVGGDEAPLYEGIGIDDAPITALNPPF